jgi:uncharacterized membrane protein YvlD (DUF360 family)
MYDVGRFRWADLWRMLVAWVISTLALAITAALLDGFSVTAWWPLAVVAAVTGVLGALIRPVLVFLVSAIGWIAVAAGALLGQAAIMLLALSFVPEVYFASFWTAVAAAWVAAAVGTALAWLLSAGTDETFSLSLWRRRKKVQVADPDIDGVVFVQLDGVAGPIMHWALQSGTMPTLRRWVDAGSHELNEWTVQMPCTTPASQQAILHGTADGVPAFRWYDRELGRILVANRPADAAVIEQRASTGHGLLADGGVSISNLFTGDAPRAQMTMSKVEFTRGARRTRQVVARFLVRPDGLARSIARTIAEIVRERFQAMRQRRLDVHPRVHRSWTFAALRAVSNGLMRDLNTAIVAEEMMRGTRCIYVDYVDYDEVAHHAGATRLESLAALTALDQVLGILEKVAEAAPRRYHVVALSDHGQSQGEPFASRYGQDLAGVCSGLAKAQVTGVQQEVEGWGRVGSMVDDLAGDDHPTERMARSVAKRVSTHTDPEAAPPDSEFIVLGSGNLGLVYVPEPRRLLLEDLDKRWPGLVSGLAAHPGIGFVSLLTASGPKAFGRRGSRHLVTGEVTGEDPLWPFGDHAPAMLRDATLMPQAPDIYVNSIVDPGTDEVAAFEPLVGCHGGLGGWQDRGFLLAPPGVVAPGEPILGGEGLHRHLVGFLESLGHRRDLATKV